MTWRLFVRFPRFFLSILQWLGALPNATGDYTPDNLAAAIQDSLTCFEMPMFAVAHWYAFSWHDYADSNISAARLPVKYALRDALGAKDLIEDTKITLRGENYAYRLFDSGDHIIPHADSDSRVRRVMHGMRYERGGKAKYWLPQPGEVNSRTPLLGGSEGSSSSRRGSTLDRYRSHSASEESTLDDADEKLFSQARELEFGDFNYPVITANLVPKDQRLASPAPSRSSTQPALVKRARKSRKSHASSSGHRTSESRASRSSRPERSENSKPQRKGTDSPKSQGSHRSQLVDLVVEDREAEEEERGHIQRAFGSVAVEDEPKHFQRPSGDPVDERATNDAGGNTEISNKQAKLQELDDQDASPKTPAWDYRDLDDDNVWSR
ncbi:uncharacterized protein DSM5745_02068 [Aspergillus mulundensis]|uniref:Uncharacterized protein n=1 Tax=Aspergillus mulundensis TaxID=1810919 RepID=A0A3D8SVE7_9EURO|nr:hypothetical protein DSM5745_02068 [Aspergillus mulundensis]RDW90293.1 hypothetical protein DSM5745_02068 [Aspergillus mulundensis]